MATYKCRKCNIQKNDTLISQLETKPTCSVGANDINFHDWEQVSQEDLTPIYH